MNKDLLKMKILLQFLEQSEEAISVTSLARIFGYGKTYISNMMHASFAKGDATHLDFPDERFDAVVSNYVYHNIPSRDRQAILLETLRVLKPGGTFALHDIFSRAKYGDMQAFVQKLRDMGCREVQLISTTNGNPITPFEAIWMELAGSALLVGKK